MSARGTRATLHDCHSHRNNLFVSTGHPWIYAFSIVFSFQISDRDLVDPKGREGAEGVVKVCHGLIARNYYG